MLPRTAESRERATTTTYLHASLAEAVVEDVFGSEWEGEPDFIGISIPDCFTVGCFGRIEIWLVRKHFRDDAVALGVMIRQAIEKQGRGY